MAPQFSSMIAALIGADRCSFRDLTSATGVRGVIRPWPKALSEQVRAVRAALVEQPAPATPAQLTQAFKGAQTKRVTELLQTLDALGQARSTEHGRFARV